MAEMIELRKEMDELVELMRDTLKEPEFVSVWAGEKNPLPILKETLSLMQDQMDRLESILKIIREAGELPDAETKKEEPLLVN